MKFRLTFKTPDVFDQALDQMPDKESEDAFKFVFNKWVQFGELITVEFNTETQTATVIR